MIRRTPYLVLLVGLTLVACTSNKSTITLLTPDASVQATDADQGQPPVSNLLAGPTPTTFVAPDINIETDNDLYKQGESIVVSIENNANNTIHFMENCSLNVCIGSGANWICEERECDGPLIVIEPGSRLEILLEAKSIVPTAVDTKSRFKLDYQVVSEDPFFFAHSNEFTVQSAEMNCKQAREIALEHAKSGPNWSNLDATRVNARWQDEDQTCKVDFAGKGAEQIRTGVWSEGYYVIVSARSGQVLAANAYER